MKPTTADLRNQCESVQGRLEEAKLAVKHEVIDNDMTKDGGA